MVTMFMSPNRKLLLTPPTQNPSIGGPIPPRRYGSGTLVENRVKMSQAEGLVHLGQRGHHQLKALDRQTVSLSKSKELVLDRSWPGTTWNHLEPRSGDRRVFRQHLIGRAVTSSPAFPVSRQQQEVGSMLIIHKPHENIMKIQILYGNHGYSSLENTHTHSVR